MQNHSPKYLEFLLWLGLAIACSFAYSPSFLVPEVSWQIHENSEGCSQRLQKSLHWNNLNCRNLYYYISVVSFSFVTTYLPIRWIKPDKWPLGRKRGVWGSIIVGFHSGSWLHALAAMKKELGISWCFQQREIQLAVIWHNFSARRKMFNILPFWPFVV